jgi:hypothetical protein
MKTFKDLVFHPNRRGGVNSRTDFDNGFSLSVVAGGVAYSTPRDDSQDPEHFSAFEIAVFAPDGEFTREFFPEDHSDDVMGWQSRADINTILLQIQNHNE